MVSCGQNDLKTRLWFCTEKNTTQLPDLQLRTCPSLQTFIRVHLKEWQCVHDLEERQAGLSNRRAAKLRSQDTAETQQGGEPVSLTTSRAALLAAAAASCLSWSVSVRSGASSVLTRSGQAGSVIQRGSAGDATKGAGELRRVAGSRGRAGGGREYRSSASRAYPLCSLAVGSPASSSLSLPLPLSP